MVFPSSSDLEYEHELMEGLNVHERFRLVVASFYALVSEKYDFVMISNETNMITKTEAAPLVLGAFRPEIDECDEFVRVDFWFRMDQEKSVVTVSGNIDQCSSNLCKMRYSFKHLLNLLFSNPNATRFISQLGDNYKSSYPLRGYMRRGDCLLMSNRLPHFPRTIKPLQASLTTRETKKDRSLCFFYPHLICAASKTAHQPAKNKSTRPLKAATDQSSPNPLRFLYPHLICGASPSAHQPAISRSLMV